MNLLGLKTRTENSTLVRLAQKSNVPPKPSASEILYVTARLLPGASSVASTRDNPEVQIFRRPL